MKIKSMIAALAASAIAVSAMAVSASAAITNENSGDGKYKYDITVPEGCKLTDVYGVLVTFDKAPGEGESNVGAICYNSDSTSWKQVEFSQTAGEKELDINSDNTVKLLKDAPIFADTDEWAQFFVAQWSWDGDTQIDFAVTDVKVLGQDGNELTAKAADNTTTTAAPAADNTTTTAKAAETTKAATTKAAESKDSAAKTGDAGVGIAVAALALAGAAAIAARKKH